MSKKIFLEALRLVRAGRMEEAIAAIQGLEPGFVKKRLRHYSTQPDQREAALQLEEALQASLQGSGADEPVAPQGGESRGPFSAPLAQPSVEAAPVDGIGLDAPEPFLAWASADWDRSPELDLDRLRYAEAWALVALGVLGLEARARRPSFRATGQSSASRFAHALGLNALSGRGPEPTFDEPTRTVRLTRVRKKDEIEPTAERMASLVISEPQSHDVRRALRYVLIELLRNVIQHSEDPLGAVVAAQRMGPEQRRTRPMIQLAVADAGIGIPRHLRRSHPHLTDYRQALERALLPHISGTFAEGLTGSFENAGLGLYMITEMARQTGGRLLIATTGAALVVQGTSGAPSSPRFLKPAGTGFPGTLVAFEIPTDAVQDYYALMQAILRKAGERTPKRAADRWLSFSAASGNVERIPLLVAQENTVVAGEIGRTQISPALVQRRTVELDFAGMDLCTQSWLHALLFEPVRLAWALRVPIHIVNADPAVSEGLRFLESYALGG